jgi:transcriptional regulator
MADHDLKKGSTELLILTLLDARSRHGYEIGKLIESQSGGRITFRIGSLYPVLCRLEDRGFIVGRWREKAGHRRKRYYRVTAEGRRALARQRSAWKEFSEAVNQILGTDHA